MATSITSAIATQNAAGEVTSVVITGTSDECRGFLTIQIFDVNAGELIASGNAPYDGATWTKTLEVPDDIAPGQLSCDQDLQIQLFCHDQGNITQLGLVPDVVTVDCQTGACAVTINSAVGVASVGGGGLDQLTISGTATGCTSVRVEAIPVQDPSISITKDVVVTNGQWSVIFAPLDTGVGTKLKAFNCNEQTDISVTCLDTRDCAATSRLTVSCGADCFVDIDIDIIRSSDGQNLGTSNVTCDEADSGNYSLQVSGPAGSQITVIRWTESNSITDTQTPIEDDAGIVITSNPLGVNITYPTDQATNFTYSALVRDENGCIGMASATFSCGGDTDEDPNAPVDCVVSRWGPWSRCTNGVQRRTRRIVRRPRNGGRRCPALEETRRCPPERIDCEVSEWSDWSRCRDHRQRRTRQIVTPPQNGGEICPPLEETRRCGEENGICDPCCIWNWINIGLFIITAIVVLVTCCMLDATVWTAVGDFLTGGALTPVLAALTTADIVMLSFSAGLLLACLVSWFFWLVFCLPNNPNACRMLADLMIALSLIVSLTFILIWVFLGFALLGCAAGAVVDFAWFGMILAITTLIYTALGCFDD